METMLVVATWACALTFWWSLPRCPECGCLRNVTSEVNRRIRHCRRCFTTYELRR